MIHTYLAHSQQDTDGNLGKAYNDFAKLVPEDDWICFLDSDAIWTTKSWYRDMEKIIEENPEYSLFTCMTNRVACIYQKFDNVDEDMHDMLYHRNVGANAKKTFGTKVTDITSAQLLSGVMILIKKSTWTDINGAPDGFLGVDNCIHERVKNIGQRVGLCSGIYVYHWYRADNKNSANEIEKVYRSNAKK